MAITITATPNTLNASRRYIRFTSTSSRYAGNIETGVTVSDNGSTFCRYSKAGIGAAFLVGDVVTPTLFSTRFNVRQTITAIDAGNAWIDTNLAWVTDSDLSGTVTRTNDNFKVKCDIYCGGTLKGTIYKQAVSSTFTFYIEKFVDSVLSYSLPTQGLSTIVSPLANHITAFYCIFSEYYDNEAGISTLCADAAVTSSTYQAIKASRKDSEAQAISSLYDMTSNASLFLTNAPNDYTYEVSDKQEVGLCFFSDSYTAMDINYTLYDAAMNVLGTGTWTGTVTGKYGMIPIGTMFSIATDRYIDVWLTDHATGTQRSKKFKFKVNTKKFTYTKHIMFQNRLGGWDWFDFNFDYALTQETEKSEIRRKLDYGFTPDSARSKETIYANPVQKITAVSRFITATQAEWLMELQSSKQVFLNSSANKFYPLNNIELDIPLNYDDTGLIQVTLTAELGQIE